MKTNMKKIAIVALVAIIAVGSYFVSGTYAKYTSEVAGTDNANVAKWNWTINGDVIDTYEKSIATAEHTFNLFDIKDSDGTSAEEEVAANLIAPGTSGKFAMSITNNSQVDAKYSIEFTETQTNVPTGLSRIPVEYSVDGTTWKSDISDLDVSETAIDMGTSSSSLNVMWRWVYYVDADLDVNDTKIGFAANVANAIPNVAVTATVTLTQVD